jgi:hypothetical protein
VRLIHPISHVGVGSGRAGWFWGQFFILPDRVGFAKVEPVDHPLRWSDWAGRLIGFGGRVHRVYRVNRSIKQKIANNSIIMQNLEKSTIKMKITETKVRSVGGAGGTVEEMKEIWPKPDEISPDPARDLIKSGNQTPHMLASRTPPPHHLLHALASSAKTKTQNQKKSEV